MAEWLYDVRLACKEGAPICLFIDWRQYPSITDALQWADWQWRGTAVWDKLTCRPQKGRFRQQSEYIVWGSNGAMPTDRPVGCLPGVFRYANPQKRTHVTEKPLQLMRDLVKICEPGGRILDPFCGAGTTVLASVLEGYEAVGIEATDAYYRLGSDRVRFALQARDGCLTKLDVRLDALFIIIGSSRQDKRGKEELIMDKAFAYICASEEAASRLLRRYCKKVFELGYVPICPQLSESQYLSPDNPEERKAMHEISRQKLARCRMLVVCGREITGQMSVEIGAAEKHHLICTTLEGLAKIREAEDGTSSL